MRNVVLEILRHGDPHNQLLSPLTQYLALCGNHPGETVTVPFKHYQFLADHDWLTYSFDGGPDGRQTIVDRRRESQLQTTAETMGRILAHVPGLISELKQDPPSTAAVARDGSEQHTEKFTHLELVISASELALLPFELATAPNGFPGAGQPLALQSQAPLCITRRVRRVNPYAFSWNRPQRVLFAWHLPKDHADALVPAHHLALRAAVEPWVGRSMEEPLDPQKPPELLGDRLKVLPNASIKDIEDELSRTSYGYLHILAHGTEIEVGPDTRFGILLADANSPGQSEAVTGARMATLIRTLQTTTEPSLSLPTVVTLASCDSGNVGSIFGAGASVAHALHEAGVPLVVASQFPLSFAASVSMVETMYGGLLWGEDPRLLLCRLRRKLQVELPQTHDWASLVAYAAIPSDLDAQLLDMQFRRAIMSIDATFSLSDRLGRELWNIRERSHAGKHEDDSPRRTAVPAQVLSESLLVELEATFRKRIDEPRRRLEDLSKRTSKLDNNQRALVHGRLGSTYKRLESVDNMGVDGETAPQPAIASHCRDNLNKARVQYRRAFDADRAQGWALVQDVVLAFAMWEFEWEAWQNNRRLAQLMCEVDRSHSTRETRAWAIAGLIELALIDYGLVLTGFGKKSSKNGPNADPKPALSGLVEEFRRCVLPDERDWEAVSLHRQLKRYMRWFGTDSSHPLARRQAKFLTLVEFVMIEVSRFDRARL